MRIWKLIDLGITRQKRDLLTKLFSEEQYEKTANAIKLLFGDPTGTIKKYFNTDPNLFTFLFFKFLDNPEKIAKKFHRISNMLGDILGSILKPEMPPNSQITLLRDKGPYPVNIGRLKTYLEVEEGGCGEAFFEHTWKLSILQRHFGDTDSEILKKIKQTANGMSRAQRVSDCSSIWPTRLDLTQDLS